MSGTIEKAGTTTTGRRTGGVLRGGAVVAALAATLLLAGCTGEAQTTNEFVNTPSSTPEITVTPTPTVSIAP